MTEKKEWCRHLSVENEIPSQLGWRFCPLCGAERPEENRKELWEALYVSHRETPDRRKEWGEVAQAAIAWFKEELLGEIKENWTFGVKDHTDRFSLKSFLKETIEGMK